MLQLVVDGARGPVLERQDPPQPAPGQVLVRSHYSLVSPGTERHYVARCMRENTRLRPGYCVAGTVAALGAGVGGMAPGTPVIAMGWEYATHAEYVVVPCRLVVPVPAGCSLQDAVFATLMATAVHSADRGALMEEDRVLVIGAGLLGRLMAEVAQATAAQVVITDRHPRGAQAQQRIPFVQSDAMLSSPQAWAGQFTKVFICIQGDASDWLKVLPSMMKARGNGVQRPRIVGVGRYTAQVSFSVEMGNLDMVFAARCGEGYRDDDYVHGHGDACPLPGEASVERNLARALELIATQRVQVAQLVAECIPLERLPAFYVDADPHGSQLSVLVRYDEAA